MICSYSHFSIEKHCFPSLLVPSSPAIAVVVLFPLVVDHGQQLTRFTSAHSISVKLDNGVHKHHFITTCHLPAHFSSFSSARKGCQPPVLSDFLVAFPLPAAATSLQFFSSPPEAIAPAAVLLLSLHPFSGVQGGLSAPCERGDYIFQPSLSYGALGWLQLPSCCWLLFSLSLFRGRELI